MIRGFRASVRVWRFFGVLGFGVWGLGLQCFAGFGALGLAILRFGFGVVVGL